MQENTVVQETTSANVERDGKLEKVDPDEVEVGTVIVVQPGEKIPIDGIIEEGTSTLNTSALTGESLPRDAKAGEEVISGCINMTGVLHAHLQDYRMYRTPLTSPFSI